MNVLIQIRGQFWKATYDEQNQKLGAIFDLFYRVLRIKIACFAL